jgi:hypothetical protein
MPLRHMGGVKIQLHHSGPRLWMELSGLLRARPLHSRGKRPQYTVDRRLGWPQSRYGRRKEEKNLELTVNLTPAVQPVVRCYTD